MANRILIGNRATGGYGMYVSKPGSDVLTCAPKDLLFDSRQGVGSGLVYAFGGPMTLNSAGQNFLTTNSKDALGYIPLVVYAEKMKSGWNFSYAAGYQAREYYQTTIELIKTTSSTIYPAKFVAGTGPVVGRRTSSNDPPNGYGYGNSQACVDLSFNVLKMPCAYGYMTSAYFVEY